MQRNIKSKVTYFVNEQIYITLLNQSWPVMFAAHKLLFIILPASSSDLTYKAKQPLLQGEKGRGGQEEGREEG